MFNGVEVVWCVAVCSMVSKPSCVCCSVLQCVAVCCGVLQFVSGAIYRDRRHLYIFDSLCCVLTHALCFGTFFSLINVVKWGRGKDAFTASNSSFLFTLA